MSNVHDISVQINGNIGSSFTDAFRNASRGLADFKQEARQVQRELDRLGADFRQGRIHESQYRDETEKLTRELNRLENAQKRIQALSSFGTNVWNNTKAIAGIATGATAITATATAINSINVASDFEAQLSKVQAKTSATATELEALRDTALKLGASTSLSASETAIAMDELAAGGMNASQIIKAMPGIIAGAEASGEDLSLVSNTVSSALSIWGLKAEEASRVSDVLAMSANISAASVEDMSYAFKYAGKPAADLGYSLEDVSTAIAIMTNSGLDGSTAGTALRASLLALNKPTKAQQKLMDSLGIGLKDSNNEMKSLSGITEELAEATKDMSEAERVSTIETLVGREAVSGFLALIGTGPEKINEMTESLRKSSGAAAEASKVMKDNFAGAKEELFGSFESAQIAFATPILPVLKDTFNGISSLIEDNMDNIENAGKAVAEALEDITAPFAMTEPVKPKITPEMSFREVEEAMSEYQEDLQKYELFKGMDFSEKVIYILDETVDTIDNWMQGEGGEAIDSIFKELGTISGKAWIGAFTTSATGAIESFSEGNIVGGLALATAANMMTGGLLLKGGLSAGKWALGKGKDIYSNRKSGKATADNSTSTVVNNKKKKQNNTSKSNNKSKKSNSKNNKATATVMNKDSKSKTSTTSSKNSSSALKNFGKYGKTAGKVFLPLSLLASAADIYSADDKSKAVGSAAGGIGGGLAGAAAGAAIGSVVPIIGTAAGGIIGGIVGGLGGDWIGGKIGESIGGSNKASTSTTPASNNVSSSPAPILNKASSVDLTALNAEIKKATTNASLLTQYLGQASGMIYGSFYPLQEQTNTASNSMSLLVSYTGQASGYLYGSFYPLYEQTNVVTHNMSLLASYAGQACGWINTLSNIQTAGQRVVSALNNLEERIKNVQLPGNVQSRRVSYDS